MIWMRKLLLALACVLACWPSSMSAAIAIVFQGQGLNTASAAPTHALTTSLTAGSTLVACIQNRTDETTTITSVSDPTNGNWTAVSYVPFDHPGGTTQRTWMYYFQNNAATGTPTVTISFSGSISSTYSFAELTGAATTNVVDVEDTTPASGSSTAYAADTITPTATGIVVGCGVTTGSQTPSGVTNATLLTGTGRNHLLWTAGSNGVGVTQSMTIGSTGWIAQVVAFKEAAAGGATVCHGLLLGVGCDY